MIEHYLEMLEKSSLEKSSILTELTNLSEIQKEIVSAEKIDWDAFDKTVDDKAKLIEKLDNLDDGFESVYDRIKEELKLNKHLYKERIQNIQKLIAKITEQSTSLMALEERNKVLVTNSFKMERKKINQGRLNNKVANNYYKAMSRINYIDPQLMDKKK